jgi:prepilin-type N-terminal cleavage/methylation domain-containing protein
MAGALGSLIHRPDASRFSQSRTLSPMNTKQYPRHEFGFTLIELLVVITIIAILASIAVPTGGIVIRKAREVQAKTDLQNLVIAIKGYQTEYNRLPAEEGAAAPTSDTEIALDEGNTLLKVLMKPKDGSASKGNPRQIGFLEVKPAKGGAGGITDQGAYVDPFSKPSEPHPYNVAMDYDGDGSVNTPATLEGKPVTPGSSEMEPQSLGMEVIAWSYGYKGTGNDTPDPGTALKSWR